MRVDGRGFAVLLLLVTTACSPAAFAVRERAAARALASARSAGADGQASYEFVSARLYLDKAREESAEAHYDLALQLLDKSEQSARRARALSEERARSHASLAQPPVARERALELAPTVDDPASSPLQGSAR